MLSLLAALAAAAQPVPAATGIEPPAWVLSTIQHSEWCPAGNVRLDLRTGRYELTSRADRRICGKFGLERPVTAGRLDAARLAAVRAAALRVLADGFVKPACRDHQPLQEIVVSNGGTPVLVLTTGAATGSAPDELSCWSDAATGLHNVLDETFRSDRRRR
jgi:hypothetical protein